MNISDYQGLNILNVLKTDDEKWAYTMNWEQLHINYGDNVEWQRLKEQILLCPETREYLYAKPGPVRYRKGSRPVLENEVARVIAGCKTDRERVLAILVFIRDLYLHNGKEIPEHLKFFGGSEEVLIAKGENLCECVGRLMVALCEVMGLPGRIIMHLSGHITCEIYLEDTWVWFDPRCGMFYVDENNKLLSLVELVDNREYVKQQPDWVKEYVSKGQWTYEQREMANYRHHMSKHEVHLYQFYSLEDAPKYNYGVKTHRAATDDGLFVINKIYAKHIRGIWGDEF
ncbi:MAG: transglutaminase family protein [Clostridia bacterium]|nr:transglutaminase family protein [Clostridia bacterium]